MPENSDPDLESLEDRYIAWLKPTLPVIGVLIFTVAPVVVAFLLPREEHLREVLLERGGLVVQIAGFATLWWQLYNALQDNQQPSPVTRAASWWKARPKGCNVVVHLTGNAVASSAGSASMRARRGQRDGSVEARLSAMEYNLQALQTEFDDFRQTTNREAQHAKRLLQQEATARAASDRDLAGQVRKQAVGSADLQTVGLVWFVFGTTYSTVPDIVLCFLKSLWRLL